MKKGACPLNALFAYRPISNIIHLMSEEIKLLQCLVCKEFRQQGHDSYVAQGVLSNLYTARFPFHPSQLYVVTCWKKDKRFHKEVIEYALPDGHTIRSVHTDIEPATNSVIFRWHKHPFPAQLTIAEPAVLTIRVILDWKVCFETCLMIEKTP